MHHFMVCALAALCLYTADPAHLTHFLHGWNIYLDCSLECLIASKSAAICSSFAARGAKIPVCIGADVNV